jgi:peptidoglycan/LPS O-acetylase OafA/YrhL
MAENKTFVTRYDRPYIMGLSIIAVVLYHLVSFTNIYRHTSVPVFLNGYLGVDVFFVLSTFGLCFSFEKNNITTFYKHRIKRLFPLYLIFLLLVYFIFRPSSPLLNIILFQCSGLSAIKALHTDVEWYTPSIICVYLLFPLLYYCGKRMQHCSVWWHLLAANVVALIGHFVAPYISFGNNFVGRFPIIVSGIIIYFMYKNDRSKDVLIYISLLLLETMALAESYFLSMLMLLLVWLFKYISLRPLYKYISFIGKYSFELYLAQTLSTFYYMRVSPIENNYLMVLSAFLLTIPIFFAFIAIYKYSSKLIK